MAATLMKHSGAARAPFVKNATTKAFGPQRLALPKRSGSVIVRFKHGKGAEEKRPGQLETDKPTLDELANPTSLPRPDRVNVSPEVAEARADLGKDASFGQLQAFDGPAPETINGRLCMLAVPLCLWWESMYGLDINAQVKDHPWAILVVFLTISLASYVPIIRGYTRKEPFANNFAGLNWSPKAENWNGRVAMLGFTGILLTELATNMPTWQFWAQRLGH